MTTVDTLGDALPREMARVRDEVLPVYVEIGAPGYLAATMMRNALDRATKAIMSGDIQSMLAAYEDLKGFTT